MRSRSIMPIAVDEQVGIADKVVALEALRFFSSGRYPFFQSGIYDSRLARVYGNLFYFNESFANCPFLLDNIGMRPVVWSTGGHWRLD